MIESATLEAVGRLQDTSAAAFTAIAKTLREGMSELDIADSLQRQLGQLGISDFWSDVPIRVLIGQERFKQGTGSGDYATKSPGETRLRDGNPVFVGLSPMDAAQRWGDWATTLVYHPETPTEYAQLEFLREFRRMQIDGVPGISARSTGA